jgi:UPF0755 protein
MKPNKAKYYLIPAFICFAAVAAIVYYYFFAAFAAQHETTYLYIDSDDTADSVFAKLEPVANGSSLTGLRTLARHYDYDKNIRTGRYAIEPEQNTIHVFRMLKNGRQKPMMLTIPECRTMEQMAARLSTKIMIDSTEIIRALTSNETCEKLGYDTCTIACAFVPNTYEVYWDISVDKLLLRMVTEHEKFWNTERKQKAHTIGLEPNEVSTLASIIDEETANNDEKPMIAGMYLNRLKSGMPLQADPTVKFALKDFALKRIYHNHLEVESPYNTYKHTGLPPGPIKVASIKGIDAVLNRVNHHYLYMCAKEDFSGTHNFAVTYQEHLKNAARYTKALNERNIK